ncbi:plasma membrane fusion protein prm1 [Serendipita sp. 411]|nr:plasma membrane fusion protein prm1 [Serendipita sp. 411]
MTGQYQGLPPYLSVWDVISLGWLYYPILALLFVAFSLWIAARSASAGVEDAKKALVAACGASEKAATTAASLPRWLAQSTNDSINASIRQSIAASHKALELVLDIVEAWIDYIIDTFKGFKLCLFQFVVRGTLAVLIQFTETTTKYLSTVLNGIADGIQASMNATVTGVNQAIDVINNQINRFNSAIPFSRREIISLVPRQFPGIPNIPSIPSIPNIPIPSIPRIPTIPHVSIGFDVSVIRNFKIPDTFQNSLINLNSTIPTLDQLREELQTLVGTPFELLKKEMNTTFDALGTPNVTVPVPDMQDVQFCDGLDTSFIDDLGKDLVKVAYIGIGVLVGLALIIFAVNGFLTWLRFKFMNRHVNDVRHRWASGAIDEDGAHVAAAAAAAKSTEKRKTGGTRLTPKALLTLDNELSHSFAYKCVEIIDHIPFLHLSPVAHNRMVWFFSYIFSPSGLVCFLVGLFGIIAIGIQLIAIKPIQRKVTEEVQKAVTLVIDSVGSKINEAMLDDSTTYANAMNTQLSTIDTSINGQFFTWIDTSTGVLNNTVVAYYKDLEDGIKRVFGNTLFAQPMLELVRCVIGGKIDALQGAVAFLQDNLHIPIPRVSPDVLLLSNSTLTQVANPIAKAAIGGGENGVFGRLVDRYLYVLRGELITFGIILGVWGFIVLMGLIILIRDIIIDSKAHKQQRAAAPVVPEEDEADSGSGDHEKAHGLDLKGKLAAAPAWLGRLKFNRTASSATATTAVKDNGDEHHNEKRASNDDHNRNEQAMEHTALASARAEEGLSTAVPSPVSTPAIEERQMQPMPVLGNDSK